MVERILAQKGLELPEVPKAVGSYAGYNIVLGHMPGQRLV